MAASFVWDPDRVLQITDLGRGEITCIGRAASRFNARCTWTIKEPESSEVSSLLSSMAQEPPTEVRREALWELAGLCLCHQAHQHQQSEAYMELQSRIQYACEEYERFRTLQEQNAKLCSDLQREKSSTLLERLKAYNANLDISELQSRETNLGLKVKEQEKDLGKLRETERDMKTRFADMSQLLNRQTTTIAELQESGSVLRRKSGHLEQLLQNEKLTVTELEKSRKGLEEQLTELCQQLSNKKLVVDDLVASKSDLEQKLQELRQQLNKQSTAVGQLERENRALKDQRTTAEAELGTSQLKIEQMKSELKSVQNSKVDIQHQLNEAVLLLNNTWLTRLRYWLHARQLSLTKVFGHFFRGFATVSARFKGIWFTRGFFTGTEPVVGQYSEV